MKLGAFLAAGVMLPTQPVGQFDIGLLVRSGSAKFAPPGNWQGKRRE